MIRFKLKQNDNQINHAFLLISLYLFLIIFFVIFTKNIKFELETSIKAKDSVEKKFNQKKLSDKIIVKDLFVNYIKQYFYEKIIIYVNTQPNIIPLNTKDSEIVKFSSLYKFFFDTPNEITKDKKLFLLEISNILKKIGITKYLGLDITLYYNSHNFNKIINYYNILNIYLVELNIASKINLGLIYGDQENIIFRFYIK